MRYRLFAGILALLALFLLTQPVSAAEFSLFEGLGDRLGLAVEHFELKDAVSPENRGFGLAIAVFAGLVDGTNVCGLTLLLLFAGYLLIFIKNRRRAMLVGVTYLATIFVVYFLMGVLFASSIQSLVGWEYYDEFQRALNYTIIIVLTLAGLLNFQDFFFFKKLVFGVDSRGRQTFRHYLHRIDLPTTVGLGVISVIFLLPCSLPLYVGSVGLLAQVFPLSTTIFYVFIYSLMFVLPMLITMAVILRTEKVVREKDIKSERFRWLKLVKGVIQLLAALGFYLLVF